MELAFSASNFAEFICTGGTIAGDSTTEIYTSEPASSDATDLWNTETFRHRSRFVVRPCGCDSPRGLFRGYAWGHDSLCTLWRGIFRYWHYWRRKFPRACAIDLFVPWTISARLWTWKRWMFSKVWGLGADIDKLCLIARGHILREGRNPFFQGWSLSQISCKGKIQRDDAFSSFEISLWNSHSLSNFNSWRVWWVEIISRYRIDVMKAYNGLNN